MTTITIKQTPTPAGHPALYEATDHKGVTVASFKGLTLTQCVRWLEQGGGVVRLG